MAKKQGLGSVKRFGARYGRTTKQRLALIEQLQKSPQKCPYCLKSRVKRIATGIFNCVKCNSKFTGKAFTVNTSIIQEQEKVKIPVEEKVEQKINV